MKNMAKKIKSKIEDLGLKNIKNNKNIFSKETLKRLDKYIMDYLNTLQFILL